MPWHAPANCPAPGRAQRRAVSGDGAGRTVRAGLPARRTPG